MFVVKAQSDVYGFSECGAIFSNRFLSYYRFDDKVVILLFPILTVKSVNVGNGF